MSTTEDRISDAGGITEQQTPDLPGDLREG